MQGKNGEANLTGDGNLGSGSSLTSGAQYKPNGVDHWSRNTPGNVNGESPVDRT
jgi:hypothetical protein